MLSTVNTALARPQRLQNFQMVSGSIASCSRLSASDFLA